MLTGNSLIRQRLDDLIGEGELHWDEFKANGKGVIQDSMQFAQSSGSSNPYSLFLAFTPRVHHRPRKFLEVPHVARG
jgi:hypothetical protein